MKAALLTVALAATAVARVKVSFTGATAGGGCAQRTLPSHRARRMEQDDKKNVTLPSLFITRPAATRGGPASATATTAPWPFSATCTSTGRAC
jgi:hypothetical protein